MALPGRPHGSGGCALPPPPAHGAEQGRRDPRRRLGAIERAARQARGGGGRRLPRPRILRLLRRVRLLQAAGRRGLADALRSRRRGRPPRPAIHRSLPRVAPHRRIPPQPRPLHAQAPLGPSPPWRCASSPPGPTRYAPPAATVLPGNRRGCTGAHARQALFRARGTGLRERAAGSRCAASSSIYSAS